MVAELTHLARRSSDISQRSGVSVRVSICNYENLLSNALKRAIRLGEDRAAPRVSDLAAIAASTTGKIELEAMGDGAEDKVLAKLMQRAVLDVFNRHFSGSELDEVVGCVPGRPGHRGRRRHVGAGVRAPDRRRCGPSTPPCAKLGAGDPAGVAAAVEFVLEGLHLSKKLNKDMRGGHPRYRS